MATDQQAYDAESVLPLKADDLTAEHYWLTARSYRRLKRGSSRVLRVHQFQKCARDRAHAKQTKRIDRKRLVALMAGYAGDLVWCKRCVGSK
jgi:hypothetical protein